MNAQTIASTSEVIANLSLAFADRKLTTNDIDTFGESVLWNVAVAYANSYNGTFEYMRTIKSVVDKGWNLSAAQVAGTINCAIADYRYNARKSAPITETLGQPMPAPANATEQVVADGWYTIVGPKGGHRTLKIETIQTDNSNGIKQWVSYLCGPDNSGDYKTVGTLNGATFTMFKRYSGQFSDIEAAAKFLVRNVAKLDEMGRQYAIRSGKCYVCNRRLTTPQSVANGIGPVCAEKRGI